MQITKSFIRLKNLHITAYHGVLPQEQIVGNEYVVNLSLAYDVTKAATTDNVKDTISYAEVFQLVQSTMKEPHQLLEKVTTTIGENIFRHFPKITEIEIEVTKKNPPMGAHCDGASVFLHLINDKI